MSTGMEFGVDFGTGAGPEGGAGVGVHTPATARRGVITTRSEDADRTLVGRALAGRTAFAPASRREQLLWAGVLLVATGAPLDLLTERGYGSENASMLLWAVFYAVAGVLAWKVRVRAAQAATRDWPTLALVAYATMSTAWSVAAPLTLRRSVGLFGTCVVGWYLAARFTLPALRRLLVWVSAVSIVGSVLFLFIPDFGVSPPDMPDMPNAEYDGAWRGMYTTKNLFAQVMVLAALTLACEAASAGPGWRRVRLWLGALAATALIFPARSASSLALLALMVCAVPLALALRGQALKLIGWGTAMAAVVALGSLSVSASPDALFALFGRDSTLTGRTPLWAAVLEEIARRPWFGWGHAAFWLGWAGEGSLRVEEAIGWSPGYAHNGFLDQALNLGIVGVVLLLAALGGAARNALWWVRRERGRSMSIWPLLTVLFLVLANLTEGGLVRQNGYMWLLLVSVSAALRLARDDAAAADAGAGYWT